METNHAHHIGELAKAEHFGITAKGNNRWIWSVCPRCGGERAVRDKMHNRNGLTLHAACNREIQKIEMDGRAKRNRQDRY